MTIFVLLYKQNFLISIKLKHIMRCMQRDDGEEEEEERHEDARIPPPHLDLSEDSGQRR